MCKINFGYAQIDSTDMNFSEVWKIYQIDTITQDGFIVIPIKEDKIFFIPGLENKDGLSSVYNNLNKYYSSSRDLQDTNIYFFKWSNKCCTAQKEFSYALNLGNNYKENMMHQINKAMNLDSVVTFKSNILRHKNIKNMAFYIFYISNTKWVRYKLDQRISPLINRIYNGIMPNENYGKFSINILIDHGLVLSINENMMFPMLRKYFLRVSRYW